MEQWVKEKIAAGRRLFFNATADVEEGYQTDQELSNHPPA